MTREYFSYDPVTGIRTDWDFEDETGIATFYQEEDIEGLLKVAAETRATNTPMSYTGHDEKWWPEAVIPATVINELLKKGINVLRYEDKDATDLAREIETNYPHLKLTDKKIWRPT